MADIKHTTQAAGTDAGNGEIGKTQWNESHALTGTANYLLGFDGSGDATDVDPATFATGAEGDLAASASQPGHTHTKANISDFVEADYATGAEGDLATSAVQPGANVSVLTNDAGYLTSQFPAFTADGAITVGDPVILNGDNTVSSVAGSIDLGITATQNTAVSAASQPRVIDAVYDPINDVFVVLYVESTSEYVYAIAASLSGTTFTWGSPLQVSNSESHRDAAGEGGGMAIRPSDGQIVACFNQDSGVTGVYATAFSITSGTTLAIDDGPTRKEINAFPWFSSMAYAGGSVDRFYMFYTGISTGYLGYMVKFSVTAGTMGASSAAITVSTSATYYPRIHIAADGSVGGCIYENSSSSGTIHARWFIPSTGTDTFGTAVQVDATANCNYCDIVYEPVNDVWLAGYILSSDYMTFRAYTVSNSTGQVTGTGTDLSLGDNTCSAQPVRVITDSLGTVFALYTEHSTAHLTAVYLTFSGTGNRTITASSEVEISADHVYYTIGAAYGNGDILCLAQFNVEFDPFHVEMSVVNTNAADYFGIAQATVANAEDVNVALKYNYDETQTGMTKGQQYWLDYDGTLATADTGYPIAGTAITPTLLNVGV